MLLLQGINRVLLENLLPAHVATHFLSILKGRPSEELYSQKVNGSLKVQRQEMLYGYTSTRVSYPWILWRSLSKTSTCTVYNQESTSTGKNKVKLCLFFSLRYLSLNIKRGSNYVIFFLVWGCVRDVCLYPQLQGVLHRERSQQTGRNPGCYLCPRLLTIRGFTPS